MPKSRQIIFICVCDFLSNVIIPCLFKKFYMIPSYNVFSPLVSIESSLLLSSVQSLSCFRLFATPWITVRPASLSIINSQSLLKLMSIDSVTPSNHLILASPTSPALNLPQNQDIFQWVSSSHQVAKVLEFQLQHQSFQWTPRTDLL